MWSKVHFPSIHPEINTFSLTPLFSHSTWWSSAFLLRNSPTPRWIRRLLKEVLFSILNSSSVDVMLVSSKRIRPCGQEINPYSKRMCWGCEAFWVESSSSFVGFFTSLDWTNGDAWWVVVSSGLRWMVLPDKGGLCRSIFCWNVNT